MAVPDLQGALWAWVQTLPPWQSDLLRRLTTIEDVSDDDIADATRMVLTFFGSDDAGAPVPIPALAAPTAHRVTQILALKDLVAVGSIEAGQRLDFVPDGLTIVFGETGSGKSSYARVLRKACRSSAKPVEILANVLAPGSGRAGTAQLEVSLDGSIRLLTRDVNAAPEADLSEVCVFDADCANVYAGEESEITYTPSSLRLFERLVSFQAQIRKSIEERARELNATTVPNDGFDPTTRAGALVGALNENVSVETVDALATVSHEELARLEDLRAQVTTAKMVDPARTAVQLDKRAAAMAGLADVLENLARRVDGRVVGELLTLNARMASLTAASSELSAALSRTVRSGVGGMAWKALWRAAHSYVDSLPAGSATFPPSATATDSHCPLCQQDFDEDARQRMERFEEFFRGDVEKALETARADRDARVADVVRVPAEARGRIPQVGVILGGETALENAIEMFLATVAGRAEGIGANATAAMIEAPAVAVAPVAEMRALVTELGKKAEAQRALATPDAITKTNREIAELENRLLLSQRRGAVLARIEAAKLVAKLRLAFSALTTTGLSRRIGELTESAVTEQLRVRLTTELQTLGGDHIPVHIGARGIKGKTKVSLELNTTQKVDVVDVLSEGERRAVALAFFLAEVAVAEHGGGIVLDDPVSSLDHTRRSYVAHRLIQEAGRRQTIVFTHDIVFLLELQAEATRAGRAHEVRVVRRIGSASGVASQDLPWVAQNVKQRIGVLKKELQDLGALERKGDQDKYRREAKVWFVLLREAWERAVEEKLFGGVVGRFQPAIETLKLKTVEVVPAMTATVHQGMTRASAWAHDQAPALGRPPPTAKDLSEALAELEAFVAQFK